MTTKKNVNSGKCYDAKIWTREFINNVKQRPTMVTNPELIIGWFECALQAGFNKAMGKSKKK